MGDEVGVGAVAETITPEALSERLGRVFDRKNDGDGMPVTVVELVEGTVADMIDAGAEGTTDELVLPPVSELMEQCGFEVRYGFAAREGADWDAFGRIRAATAVAGEHGLGLEGAQALMMLSQLYHLFVEGKVAFGDAKRAMAEDVAQLLADPQMGEAFVDAAASGTGGAALEPFFEALVVAAGRHHEGPLAWVRSVVARRAGEHERAEALLVQALEDDPEHLEALEDAAWYASDRGDARRAFALLDRLAAMGDDVAEARVAVLRPHADPRHPAAGRNEPCPCGSGRKHKHCCLGKPKPAPLPDRVRWIWEKLYWFVSSSDFDEYVEDVVDVLGQFEASDYLLATSLVLFQDRAVEEFLAERGPLLPHDEWNLVSQWALVERSVHEVVSVNAGAGVTLRDIRTGDVVEVRERTGSKQMAAGDLLCAHVVPDGAGHQIVGGVFSVPLRLRDPLVALLDSEPDALEFAALVARASAPPELFTMEHEPMVMCEARYRILDPAAAARLDALLDRDDELRWSEKTEVDGRRWIRGTVAVEDGELVVTANSEARFSRLRDMVEAEVPGLELVTANAMPAAEMMSQRDRRPVEPDQPPPPEVALALAEFVREQEERWVDEPVPALGGLTPRQAAADPTRREQLVALLHDFDRAPAPPGAATFDTRRLRATLGLDR
ncbi:MAG: SEC-C domain-containing protein [Actinobacteria bacterium]|nr:SEC-C domain-containing protein [Actinomycetota bacterium]